VKILYQKIVIKKQENIITIDIISKENIIPAIISIGYTIFYLKKYIFLLTWCIFYAKLTFNNKYINFKEG